MILVSALDNSGQMYAAQLVRLLREEFPMQTFVGIGGKDLEQAGCELVHDVSDTSAMLAGVVGALKWAVPAYRKLTKLMSSEKIDLVILVDSPTFNLPLAKTAKKRGIKTLYYIAPQVWAWAEFRVRKIRKRVDRLAVILPFEESYFQKHGIQAKFVGHPFINLVKDARANDDLARTLGQILSPRLLLMPGSRRHVISELLPVQLRIAQNISEQIGPLTVNVAAWKEARPLIVDTINRHGLNAHIPGTGKVMPMLPSINVFDADRRTLIEQSSLVLAASGTGTLEVAWHGRPMLIMYNASRIGYHLLGRWLIKTPYLSLINILAGRELVPEYMPYIRDERAIVDQAVKLLKNKELACRLGWDAQALVRTLYQEHPIRRVADLATSLIKDTS